MARPHDSPADQAVPARDGVKGRLLGADLAPGQPIPLVVGFRWAALAIGGVIIALEPDGPELSPVVWLSAVAVYAGCRTLAPLRFGDRRTDELAILAEVTVSAAAVSSTGGWSSPFVFLLLTAVLAAGFAHGYGLAVRVAASSAALVLLVKLPDVDGEHEAALQSASQLAAVLLLVAIVSGYARHISITNAAALAADRVHRLSEANDLLFSLHQVAQQLPESLDLEQVLTSGMEDLTSSIHFERLAVLLRDDTSDRWIPVRRDGCHDLAPSRFNELPDGVQLAARGRTVISASNLDDEGQRGLTAGARSGVYAPLRARGTVIGMVVVESTRGHLDPEVAARVEEMTEPFALSIDNAQWFAKLRTLGAEEERTRIARDLHDRIGQSLAYLGFELDRVRRSVVNGEDVTSPLETLRGDVTTVIAEVRDTLSDLRTDVSDDVGLCAAMRDHLGRVTRRSGLQVELVDNERERLPLPQERELLRIATEAITNAERHAQANRLVVRWASDGRRAELTVSDDGIGLGQGPHRADAYGLRGMRERATAIGARLDLTATPGGGTTVRVKVGG